MINAIGQKIHTDLSQEQLDCLIRLLEERKQQIVEQLSEAANRSDVEGQKKVKMIMIQIILCQKTKKKKNKKRKDKAMIRSDTDDLWTKKD
ncbi:MAG TPA: hypothetical protein VIP70_12080 [Nitrososphaeraceae archaeon]